MSRFKKGDDVLIVISGSFTTKEPGKVLKVTKKGVWLDSGPGNDPSGPFDPISGRDLSGLWVPGFTRHIEAA